MPETTRQPAEPDRDPTDQLRRARLEEIRSMAKTVSELVSLSDAEADAPIRYAIRETRRYSRSRPVDPDILRR